MSDATVPMGSKRSVTGAWFFTSVALMLIFVLVGTYLGERGGRNWPDPKASLENFSSVLITMTLLMGSVTIEWAARSAGKSGRGTMSGFGLTAFFGLAALNAIYFHVDGVGIGRASSPYAVMYYSVISAATIFLIVSTVAVFVGILRSINPQNVNAANSKARAVATIWHGSVISWLVVYTALYLIK